MEELYYLYALYYEVIWNKNGSVSESNASLKRGPFQ